MNKSVLEAADDGEDAGESNKVFMSAGGILIVFGLLVLVTVLYLTHAENRSVGAVDLAFPCLILTGGCLLGGFGFMRLRAH